MPLWCRWASKASLQNMEEASTCPLCARPIPEDQESRHHLVPKSFKGRETVILHRICHRKIHSLFTERELAKTYHTIEALKKHTDILAFLEWLEGKPPRFYKPTFAAREKKRR